MKHLGLCYLATPYTNYPDGHEQAFIDASKLVARMIIAGFSVFSPIVHTHSVAVHGNLNKTDHNFWLGVDDDFMIVSKTLLIAQMKSWEESDGIERELKRFKELEKKYYYLDPETLSLGAAPSPLARAENE